MADYDPVDLAYVAGIVDGEGTIGISMTKPYGSRVSPYFRSYCAVVMTDPTVPYFMYGLFGGSIHTYKGRQEQHKATTHWRSSGKITTEVCRLLLPYLKVKQHQAKLVIEFNERVRNCTTRSMPPDELAERLIYVHKIHLLNKRGT
jgi:hypothetical protein